MDIKKHVTDEERTSLTVTLEPEELEEYLEECYGLIAERYGIYSNSGEEILAELAQKVGEEAARKLLDDLVMNNSAPFAITQEAIDMISSPLFFPEEPVRPGESFTYSMSLLTKPKLELSSYEPLKITIPSDVPEEDKDDFLRANVVAGIAERLETKISDEIFETTFSDIQKARDMDLAKQGMDLDMLLEQQGMDKQQYQMAVMLQAREQLKQSFALDALAQYLEIVVDDDDRAAACEEMAPGQGELVRKTFEASGRMFLVDETARRIRVRQWLVDTAEVGLL